MRVQFGHQAVAIALGDGLEDALARLDRPFALLR
jgi:hypothetical protein